VRVVHVSYYTDPASPRSWAAEPVVRRVLSRFGEGVSISYVMGGLARDISDPLSMLRDVLGAAAESAMPVDPRLWLDHPPASTYPSCLAVKAAAEQGCDVAFLRRAREGFMCERRRGVAGDRELPGPLAAAELWRLAAQWKVRPVACLSGELWEPA
jgi:predicted DsbA family dithiol-disulfide isomerase